MRVLLTIASLFWFLTSALSQELTFQFTVNDNPLTLNEPILTKDGIITIETAKVYISNITSDSEEILVEHHLLDAADAESLTLPISASDIKNNISFTLGIDSITNHEGVHGGCLDPMLGMYWSWQSGYIHVKLEGSRTIKEQVEEFTYHLGGFRYPHHCTAELTIPVTQNDNLKTVEIHLDEYLTQAFSADEFMIMSPSEEAVQLIQKLAASIRIVP